MFFCATVQYMYKHIYRPTQAHIETYICMKKIKCCLCAGLTLQNDAGVSKCGPFAVCVTRSCFWPFSHSGWSTLRPHQVYPWMGAFLFHQKSGNSFYSYCLLGMPKGTRQEIEKKKKNNNSMATPVFLSGKSHGQRSLVGWVARSRIQLSKHTHAHAHTRTRAHTWIWRTICGNLIQHPYFQMSK